MHLTRPIILLALLALATSVTAPNPGRSGRKKSRFWTVVQPPKEINTMTLDALREWAKESPICSPGRRVGKYTVQCEAGQTAVSCLERNKLEGTVVTGMRIGDSWSTPGSISTPCKYPIPSPENEPSVGSTTLMVDNRRKGRCCTMKALGDPNAATSSSQGPQAAAFSYEQFAAGWAEENVGPYSP